MRVLCLEPEHPKTWGRYNQYHGLLKVASYHRNIGDEVDYQEFNQSKLGNKTYDIIYISSLFSYWEPYYINTIKAVKFLYPKARVIFGGIWAFNGGDRVKKWEQTYGVEIVTTFPEAVNEIPDVSFLQDSTMASILTSRGCPNSCSYCSSNKIYGFGWQPRSIDDVINEINYQVKQGAKEFAIYDDNFLFKSEAHAIPLLKSISKLVKNKELPGVSFALPSGFQASHMTEEIATLMKEARFKGRIATAIESTNELVLRSMKRSKWSGEEPLKKCVDYLVGAGFKAPEINVFTICGLPYQTMEDMVDTCLYINNLNCYINLQRFAPIPGTVDFDRCGLNTDTMDMELTEGRKYVAEGASFNKKDLSELSNFVKWLNAGIRYSPVNLFKRDKTTVFFANKYCNKLLENLEAVYE